jgi:membrane-associated phospholipid phosphatase
MKTKTLLSVVLALLGAVLLSIVFIDRPLAAFAYQQLGGVRHAAGAVTTALEWIFAFEVSKYLYAFVLLLIGAALHLVDRRYGRARFWYFVGATLLLSRVISGTLKNVFERLRPLESIRDGRTGDFFVDGGSAFPSGHSAFYFGLFFPLALLFPRLRWLFIALAAIGALARVFEVDHYLSDVLASAVVAVLLTAGLAKLLGVPRAALAQSS